MDQKKTSLSTIFTMHLIHSGMNIHSKENLLIRNLPIENFYGLCLYILLRKDKCNT